MYKYIQTKLKECSAIQLAKLEYKHGKHFLDALQRRLYADFKLIIIDQSLSKLLLLNQHTKQESDLYNKLQLQKKEYEKLIIDEFFDV